RSRGLMPCRRMCAPGRKRWRCQPYELGETGRRRTARTDGAGLAWPGTEPDQRFVHDRPAAVGDHRRRADRGCRVADLGRGPRTGVVRLLRVSQAGAVRARAGWRWQQATLRGLLTGEWYDRRPLKAERV